MKVSDIMTPGVRCCRSTDTLRDAAQIMGKHDCGSVPVVDGQRRVVGIITDRDICIAAYSRGEPIHELSVAAFASRGIVTVLANESIAHVEALMKAHQIRRIVVVDTAGRPAGIVSMSDLATSTRHENDESELGPDAIMGTLASICQPTLNAETAAAVSVR